MPKLKDKVWTVIMRRNKTHLAACDERGGPKDLTLCMKPCGADAREGGGKTIRSIRTDQAAGFCQKCLKSAGYIDPEVRINKAFIEISKALAAVPFTAEKRAAILWAAIDKLQGAIKKYDL